jgi:hypothetical protein
MEARIGELLQHKVSNIGTIHTQRARRERVGQDAVGAGKGAIQKPRSTHYGVVQVAGCKQTFLLCLIEEGILQDSLFRHPPNKVGQCVLILAVIGLNSGGTQDNEPVHILLAHAFKDVRQCIGEHICLFARACPESGKDRAMSPDRIDDRAEVVYVSLNDTKMRILRQPLGITGKSSDRVSLSQRLRNKQPTRTSGGAEDSDLHVSPVVPFPVVPTTTLYKAQPFRDADI